METRQICEICSKLKTKIPERLLSTDLTYFSGVFIVDFEQVNAGWDSFKHLLL